MRRNSPERGPVRVRTSRQGSRAVRPVVESLEGRRLLAVTIQEFPILAFTELPGQAVVGPDGKLWFTDKVLDTQTGHYDGMIGRVTPTGTIRLLPLPTAGDPVQIAVGPDGNLWCTVLAPVDGEPDRIDRIAPDGTITEFPTPMPENRPDEIAAGSDGNVWFTAPGNTPNDRDAVGRITPAGVITEFPLAVSDSEPGARGLVLGPDGDLWFTEDQFSLSGIGRNAIGRIAPDGTIAEFPLPTAGDQPGGLPDGDQPGGLTVGPDGALWFTEAPLFGPSATSPGKIGRIAPDGTITEFTLPGSDESGGAITTGPDGNLWFILTRSVPGTNFSNAIGRIAPDGTIAEFATPDPYTDVTSIVAGPDGALWFTENTYADALRMSQVVTPHVGRIAPDGTIAEYALPSLNEGLGPTEYASGIAAAPGGPLWFIEENAPEYNAIGRVDPGLYLEAQGLTPSTTPGSAFAGPVASFVDTSPSGSAGDYAATIAWGDGSPPSAGVVVADGRGGFLVLGTHTYAAPGSYPTIVTIVDQSPTRPAGVDVATAYGRAAVKSPDLPLSGIGLDISTTSGAGFSGPVADVADPDPLGRAGDYAATIAWGDGSPPSAGVVVADGRGGFLVLGTHTYAAPGSYRVTTTVVDVDTARDAGGSTVTMTGNALVAAPPTVVHVARHGYHHRRTRLVLTFSTPLDPARAQDPANYRITTGGPRRRPIVVLSATYDPATLTVTLRPRHRLSLYRPYRLTVNGTRGTGLTNTHGAALDGAGQSGTDFVKVIRGFVGKARYPAVLKRGPDR